MGAKGITPLGIRDYGATNVPGENKYIAAPNIADDVAVNVKKLLSPAASEAAQEVSDDEATRVLALLMSGERVGDTTERLPEGMALTIKAGGEPILDDDPTSPTYGKVVGYSGPDKFDWSTPQLPDRTPKTTIDLGRGLSVSPTYSTPGEGEPGWLSQEERLPNMGEWWKKSWAERMEKAGETYPGYPGGMPSSGDPVEATPRRDKDGNIMYDADGNIIYYPTAPPSTITIAGKEYGEDQYYNWSGQG